ncbi:MAG: T9SS type A sorting domain-containing protein, partial [candidate division Zixibacteria bacterium]|nr:T9SS type A sorting domain-containing protein [candidate division Zixibacteria bacterium]
AYHNFSNLNVTLGVDGARGIGLFTIYDPPDGMPGISYTFWPQMAIDYTGEYHILSVEHGMGDIAVPMIYTHSQNNLESWESPQYVDTIGIQAYLVAASKFDSKVAVVYAKPRQNFDADFYNNDVVYIESPDGVNWDFDNKINITNYLDEDSIRCFNSLDAVYDPEGNLHIVWVTPFYNQNTFWASVDSCLLWHWSEETGTGLITDGLNLSNPGTWNKSISSCNISVDDVGTLYVTYCRFFDDDVSHGGFSNGEIYYTFSIDNGDFWFPDENITNSESNGCMPGDCDNDMQLSAADYVDNSLYLFYINDKDAGMFSSEEGSETSNPQMYFRYPLAVDVDEDGNPFVPGSFYLAPAYPNPFNANTTLSYDIENEGNVKLEIYNVAGQKVSTLVDDLHQPGHYTVNFDADNLSSGVYYARLISSENRMVRKLALLK